MSFRATNLIAVTAGAETYLVGSSGTFINIDTYQLSNITISASVIGTWRFYVKALSILKDGTYVNSTLIFRLLANTPFVISLEEKGISAIAISFTPDANGNACVFASFTP